MASGEVRLAVSASAPSDQAAMVQKLTAQLNLWDVLRTIWRRKIELFATVFILTGLSIVFIIQLAPLYTASALVMIETRGRQVVQFEDVLSSLTGDISTIGTQIQILRSRSLAGKVIKRLGLTDDVEFNPTLAPEDTSFLRYLNPRYYIENIEVLGSIMKVLRSGRAATSGGDPNPSESARAQQELDLVIDNYLIRLSVNPVPNSYVIAIGFEAGRPSKSALIANTIGELYLVEQLEAKYEATRRATTWLNERLDELRQEVATAESAVESYRQSAGLIGGEDTTIADRQLSEINSQLMAAQSERASVETRLGQLRRLLVQPDAIESAPEVLNSALIQNLKQQETQLLRREAELSNKYRDLHPIMISARAELRDLRAKISVEAKRIVEGLANEVEVARSREATLVVGLDDVRKQVARLDRAQVRLREFEREAQATRALYETFLSRFKETSEQEGLQRPDAQIISRASPPLYPSFPKRAQMAVIAMFISGLIGLLIVFLRETLDQSFRSAEQVESLLGRRVLALVPALRGFPLIDRLFRRSVLSQATPAFQEAIRTVNTGLKLFSGETSARTVLVTSSIPHEGKTTIAAAMALQMARSGKACLLVDCDFRRAQLHKLFRRDNTEGFFDLLAGKKVFEEVVHRDEQSRLEFLTSGTYLPADLGASDNGAGKDVLHSIWGSDQMADLLTMFASRYDLVVIDAPPTMVVSDACALSPLVDKAIFVVRWGETRRDTVLSGLRKLRDSGADIVGVVLSRVNVRKYAQYGFADAGLFDSEYQKYY